MKSKAAASVKTTTPTSPTQPETQTSAATPSGLSGNIIVYKNQSSTVADKSTKRETKSK